MPLPNKLMLTFEEAAAMLNVSPTSVRRMVKAGQLITKPCPRSPMITLDSVLFHIYGDNGHSPRHGTSYSVPYGLQTTHPHLVKLLKEWQAERKKAAIPKKPAASAGKLPAAKKRARPK